MSTTLTNVVRTASETTSTAADPPDPGCLFDLPGPRHAPLPSTTDEFSLAMDVSEAVVTDLNNAVGIVPLVSSPIVVPHAPTSTPSYKDTLLASVSAASRPDVDSIDDEEVVLLEGDVARSTVNGVISIQFSERVQSLAVKNLEMNVVVKLLGRRIGYHTLRNRLYDMWKPSQTFRLMDIENDYFLVTFRSRPDYDAAVSVHGPSLVTTWWLSLGRWISRHLSLT
ncbi:hypothetical protein V6N12_069184 [Hibiscus sabdariffa]|uniref:DUF4283 domain-containing protein n=1 Tax=Hibiscus sabdariffa TaxID=183260 RepID=A0ABR2FD67_9ROSI